LRVRTWRNGRRKGLKMLFVSLQVYVFPQELRRPV
jgi:hypothetical protein